MDGGRPLSRHGRDGPGRLPGRDSRSRVAAEHEVIAVARFRDPAKRAALEAAGVTCVEADFAKGDLDAVPTDVDYVCNFAVVKSNRWDVDLAANAEAAGLLMAHCRNARAFLHCSSTGVYEAAGGEPQLETDPLGDNHRVMMPTYSISKIAAEAVVRTTCACSTCRRRSRG